MIYRPTARSDPRREPETETGRLPGRTHERRGRMDRDTLWVLLNALKEERESGRANQEAG